MAALDCAMSTSSSCSSVASTDVPLHIQANRIPETRTVAVYDCKTSQNVEMKFVSGSLSLFCSKYSKEAYKNKK